MAGEKCMKLFMIEGIDVRDSRVQECSDTRGFGVHAQCGFDSRVYGSLDGVALSGAETPCLEAIGRDGEDAFFNKVNPVGNR